MILFTNLMLVFFSQRIILDWINKHNKYKQIFKDFSQLVSHFVYEIYWFVSILFSDYGVERVINLHSRMSVTNINSFLFAWNALVFVTSLIPPIVCVCMPAQMAIEKWYRAITAHPQRKWISNCDKSNDEHGAYNQITIFTKCESFYFFFDFS